MSGRRRLLEGAAALALACVLMGAPVAEGQEAPPASAESSFLQAPDTPQRASPGGAFFRSLLVPGWGHAAVGAYSRGAFYFAAASGSGYMLFKSIAGRDAATRARDVREGVVETDLRFQGTPEDSIAQKVEEDPRVTEVQALVDSRAQQVQDWAALGIFIVLLSGADAFVSAHLMDFPEPLEVRVTPREFGRVEVGVGIPYRGPG